MRIIFFISLIFPNLCLAESSLRDRYISAVKGFSLCGNALMPWGNDLWAPDDVEKPYVEQAKLNQIRMKNEIDSEFYTKVNLEALFTSLTTHFFEETADLVSRLKLLPSEQHIEIWNELFELEKDARLVREKLITDFKLHAEIIRNCATDLSES